MTDNTTKIQTILDLVMHQSKHIESIPEMKTDIAVIKNKLENQENQLSDRPTNNEVDLKIIKARLQKRDTAKINKPRRSLNGWAKILGPIIVAIAAGLTWYFGG